MYCMTSDLQMGLEGLEVTLSCLEVFGISVDERGH